MAMWIYKMAAGHNQKWRCSIRLPRKPHPRNKHEVDRTTRRRDMAIWSFPKWPPSWIWSKRKWRRSIRRPWKPHPRTKHDGDWWTRRRVMAICSLSMCVNGHRSSVGRQYSYFLHWSHLFLFRYVRNERSARGVKITTKTTLRERWGTEYRDHVDRILKTQKTHVGN